MEVYLKDLAKMSPQEREQTIERLVRATIAHREEEPRFRHVLHAIRRLFVLRRASR